MKTVAFEVESWEREAFAPLTDSAEVVLVNEPLRHENAHRFADANIVSTFVYSVLDQRVLEQLEKLQFIATRSTGVDHIDGEECARRGIAVSNVPAYGEVTVAEHVFASLLTISHKMWEAIDRTRRGDFSIAGLRGFDLAAKTLGVIGTGAIGRHVIRIAKGFNMKVVAFDVREDAGLARELGFEYRSLADVLATADVVTVHVPATPKTRNLLSHDEFSRMKEGAVLINTSRGSVVDVKALIRALAAGRVAAAGLDVLPEEPTIREEAELLRSVFQAEHDLETLLVDHLLLRLRNVYITPHSAFYTREALQRILDTTISNIEAFRRGEPQNLVSPG